MKMFYCWSVRNVLDLHVDGRLSSGRAARLNAHLSGCPDCRKAERALRPLALKAGKTVVPSGLAAAILAGLKTVPAPAPVSVPRRLTPAQGLAVAYLALLAAGHSLGGVPSQAFAQPVTLDVEAR